MKALFIPIIGMLLLASCSDQPQNPPDNDPGSGGMVPDDDPPGDGSNPGQEDPAFPCNFAADCNDGIGCNGQEQCVDNLCQPGVPPCAEGLICDEVNRICLECVQDADCNDQLFCNGSESCVLATGHCAVGELPCPTPDLCDESAQTCMGCNGDTDCDDGQPCTRDLCVDQNCQSEPLAACCERDSDCADADPCTVDACDDGECSNTPMACDDELFCTGPERCLEGACVSQGDPCPAGNTCEEATDICLTNPGGPPPPPPPPTGACCQPGGGCSVVTQPACTTAGGTYQNDNTDCSPNPCQPPPSCPGSATGDCCTPHGTPGCQDSACCSTVCTGDDFCCDTEWDEFCVSEARQLCGSLCPPLVNDDCADASAIADGDTLFDTVDATTDGPANPSGQCNDGGENQTHNDIWYNYTASCTGNLTVSTCDQANYDTDLVVYNGCDCPPTTANLLGCNDDAGQCIDFITSEVVAPVVQGNCYKIRVGGWDESELGAGTVTVSCQ